jgi:hypothetical protein
MPGSEEIVRRAQWLAWCVTVGAVVLVASLWLPRVQLSSFEDFYGEFGGRLGIPNQIPPDARLDGLPGWFFPVPAAGQVLLAWLAWRLAITVHLRPDACVRDRAFPAKAAAVALALAAWILGTVVLYPGLDAPSMDRLAGTWIAAAAGSAAALGLLALATYTLRHRA